MTTVLSFRSVDLQADGLKFHLTQGFLAPPAPRGVDYVVPAAAGRVSAGRVADTVSLLLEGYVSADTASGWREATDDLLAILDENGADPGLLEVTGPYMGLDSGEMATINARVKNAVPGPIFAFKYQAWSIELESIDPYWVRTPPP